MIFQDRADAGQQLAVQLSTYQDDECLVLALPRGGVVCGYEVARKLHKALDILVVRKIGAPDHQELAVGAIGPGDVLVWNVNLLQRLRYDPADLLETVQREKMEMQRQLKLFRGQRLLPDFRGKTLILVDDGLATGATARSAIISARNLKALKIVLAVPIAAKEALSQLQGLVDELICLETPDNFEAVSLGYVRFPQVSDEEVIALLQKAWEEEGKVLC